MRHFPIPTWSPYMIPRRRRDERDSCRELREVRHRAGTGPPAHSGRNGLDDWATPGSGSNRHRDRARAASRRPAAHSHDFTRRAVPSWGIEYVSLKPSKVSGQLLMRPGVEHFLDVTAWDAELIGKLIERAFVDLLCTAPDDDGTALPVSRFNGHAVRDRRAYRGAEARRTLGTRGSR